MSVEQDEPGLSQRLESYLGGVRTGLSANSPKSRPRESADSFKSFASRVVSFTPGFSLVAKSKPQRKTISMVFPFASLMETVKTVSEQYQRLPTGLKPGGNEKDFVDNRQYFWKRTVNKKVISPSNIRIENVDVVCWRHASTSSVV